MSVVASTSSTSLSEEEALTVQLRQLEINATNCVRDLSTLVRTLQDALQEVNDVATSHVAQMATTSDSLASSVTASVAAADALMLQCAALRNKLAQCDSLARTTAEIRRQVAQLDLLVDRIVRS
jgi:hypothetical protein